MEFDVIRSEDLQYLKDRVNELLESGWVMNGEFKAFPTFVNEKGEVKGFTYFQSVKFGEE